MHSLGDEAAQCVIQSMRRADAAIVRGARAHSLSFFADHREEFDLRLQHVLDALEHEEGRLAAHGGERGRESLSLRTAPEKGPLRQQLSFRAKR